MVLNHWVVLLFQVNICSYDVDEHHIESLAALTAITVTQSCRNTMKSYKRSQNVSEDAITIVLF